MTYGSTWNRWIFGESCPNSLSFLSNHWKKKHDNKCVFQKLEHPSIMKYPVIICGLRVLITCDDLRRHPIWSTNEGISSTDRLVELCWDSKVNWNIKKIRDKSYSCKQPQSFCLMWLDHLCMYAWLCDCSTALPGAAQTRLGNRHACADVSYPVWLRHSLWAKHFAPLCPCGSHDGSEDGKDPGKHTWRHTVRWPQSLWMNTTLTQG